MCVYPNCLLRRGLLTPLQCSPRVFWGVLAGYLGQLQNYIQKHPRISLNNSTVQMIRFLILLYISTTVVLVSKAMLIGMHAYKQIHRNFPIFSVMPLVSVEEPYYVHKYFPFSEKKTQKHQLPFHYDLSAFHSSLVKCVVCWFFLCFLIKAF